MKRPEVVVFALFVACWVVSTLAWTGLVDLSGMLELALYPLYGVSAFLGWVSGNVYVSRSRHATISLRPVLLAVYFLGPLGLLYLLRAMATAEVRAAAPFVPLWSFGVFSIFFLVPVTLRGSGGPRGEIDLRRRSREDDSG